MFTILFTAVGRRVELVQAFQTSLAGQGVPVRVIGTDCQPELAAAAYFADSHYRVPRVTAADYPQMLLEICRREGVNLLIPLYEPEFLILDVWREQFRQNGVLLLLSVKEVLETCGDKYRTAQFFEGEEFRSPRTWLAAQLPEMLDFPLFAKPRSGMGSAGVHKILNVDQLNHYCAGHPDGLIQEYLDGTEYTLDILADLSGRVVAVVPRERLDVKGGEVAKSRTVKRADLIDEGRRIVETLGAIGPVTVQCIDTGKRVYWIEINPRFGGGVPLAIRAGVDYPGLLYRLWKGEAVAPAIGEFQEGLSMLRYDQAVYV